MKAIKLYGFHGQGKFATVSDRDYVSLNKFRWHVKKHRNTYYAVRTVREKNTGKCIKLKMHRIILEVTDPKIQVDHKDHNGLNCSRRNIRISTHIENRQNGNSKRNSTSKYLGVFKSKRENGSFKYVAQIKINDKKIHLGVFPETDQGEVEAAKAYDKMARKHFGKFSNPNFK